VEAASTRFGLLVVGFLVHLAHLWVTWILWGVERVSECQAVVSISS
jgi:hypothetical protein